MLRFHIPVQSPSGPPRLGHTHPLCTETDSTDLSKWAEGPAQPVRQQWVEGAQFNSSCMQASAWTSSMKNWAACSDLSIDTLTSPFPQSSHCFVCSSAEILELEVTHFRDPSLPVAHSWSHGQEALLWVSTQYYARLWGWNSVWGRGCGLLLSRSQGSSWWPLWMLHRSPIYQTLWQHPGPG